MGAEGKVSYLFRRDEVPCSRWSLHISTVNKDQKIMFGVVDFSNVVFNAGFCSNDLYSFSFPDPGADINACPVILPQQVADTDEKYPAVPGSENLSDFISHL